MKLVLQFSEKILILTILVILSQGSLYAQWGPNIKLSTRAMAASLNENMASCLAVSGDTVHVVWSDKRIKGSAIYYKCSIDSGLTWKSEIPITDTTGSATFPAIAVSGSIIHVVWMDTSLGHRASFYKHSIDGGNTWGPVVCLDSNTAFWPGLASSGSMVVVSLNKDIAGNTEVFFRRSMDNGTTWDMEQQISNANGRSEDPAMAALGSHIHLAWNDKRSGNMQIYYRRSSDAGVTWDPETKLIYGSGTNGSYSTMVALYGSYVDVPCGDSRNGNFDIYLKQSSDTGLSWGTDKQLTNGSNGEAYPYLVRDGLQLHLVYYQLNFGGWYLHSDDGGATWDPAVFLANGGQPFIAITGCVLHVIWIDNGIIYYKRNPTGNCGTVSDVEVKTILLPSNLALSVYPNPVKQTFIVELPKQHFDLVIRDILGRIIYENKDAYSKTEIYCKDFPDGIYFVHATTDKKNIYNSKISIRK